MTYSHNQCKAQALDRSPMQPCLPSHSSNGTRWTRWPRAESRESWTQCCGLTMLMLEMPQRSGPIWKPSMEKQEELIPTSNSSEWSNRHSPTLWIFCHKYRSSKKIIDTYYPMVTLILQRTLWFSCSVPPSPTHTKILPTNISITLMILLNKNCSRS